MREGGRERARRVIETREREKKKDGKRGGVGGQEKQEVAQKPNKWPWTLFVLTVQYIAIK